VGEGSKIRFWHDLWCGDHPLKASFPELFSISCYKEAMVAYHVQFSNGNLQWNIYFSKSVHEWEVDLVSLFFDLLYFIRLRRGGKDKICCIPSNR
jgi:hypothetical protein